MTDTKAAVMKLFGDFTVETTPNSAAKIPDYNARLRNDTPIYVTFLPGSDVYETVTLAKRLRGRASTPSPISLRVRSSPRTCCAIFSTATWAKPGSSTC